MYTILFKTICVLFSAGCVGPSEFQCRSGLCLDQREVCDGKPDCPGGEDERSCGKPLSVLNNN